MAEMREACKANHGVVFDAYLRGLIDLGKGLKPRAQAYVDEFVNSLFLKDTDGAVNHAARNFGTVYAGLRLAMDMGAVAAALAGPCCSEGDQDMFPRRTQGQPAGATRHWRRLRRSCTSASPRRRSHASRRRGSTRMSASARTEGPDELVAIRSTEFVRWFKSNSAHLYGVLAWLDA